MLKLNYAEMVPARIVYGAKSDRRFQRPCRPLFRDPISPVRAEQQTQGSSLLTRDLKSSGPSKAHDKICSESSAKGERNLGIRRYARPFVLATVVAIFLRCGLRPTCRKGRVPGPIGGRSRGGMRPPWAGVRNERASWVHERTHA